MEIFDLTRLIILLASLVVAILFSFAKLFFRKNPFTVNFLTRTAVFASVSIILYIVPYLHLAVPGLFPSFLELHFDEVPAFIAGFAYGPFSAFIIILIKTIVKLPLSTSLCVGELADFIYGIAFVIPSSFIYKKMRTFKGAMISLIVGIIIQTLTASFITSFGIINFYMQVMRIPESSLLSMCQAVNKNVTSLGWPFFLFIALPFNLLKNGIVVVLTIILYKRLIKLINKIGQKKN